MGLLDALSAGIGAAAPAGAALAQGQAQATQSNTNFLEKLAQMQQQRQAADMQRQLQTAQIGDIQAQQAQRQAQADAQARRFSPESINAAAKSWGVDPATAEMALREPQTLNYILEKKKPVPPLKVTPGEAIQRSDGTWYVPVPAKETRSKYGTFVDDTGKQRFVDETFAAQQGWLPAPKAGGAGGNKPAQGTQAPLQDMIDRYNELEQHAKDVANGTFQFTPLAGVREGLKTGAAVDQTTGHGLSGAAQQLVGSVMDKLRLGEGTDIQNRYDKMAFATRALGDDAAKVFKGRQGFENIQLETAQSKFDPSDIGQPDRVEQKLSRLRNIIKLGATVAPEQAATIDPAQLSRFGISAPQPNPNMVNPPASKGKHGAFGDLVP
jgi:hypothetical protein